MKNKENLLKKNILRRRENSSQNLFLHILQKILKILQNEVDKGRLCFFF